MKISILILNYNSKRFLKRCLDSLANQTFKEFEIILVDNASSDGSVEYAKKLQVSLDLTSKMRIIQNSSNLGQTGGDNIGAQYAKGDYLLLLDVDTWLDEKCLENLMKSVEEKRNVGIWQCKVLNDDGSLRSDGNPCDIYGGVNAGAKKDRFFYATGAFLLIQKRIWEKLGGFDEELFAYCEDLDLGWQTRLQGYDIRCATDSICYHTGSFVLGSYSPRKFFLLERNRIRVLLKNYSGIRLAKRIVPACLLLSLKGFFLMFQQRDFEYMKMIFSAFYWNLRHLRSTLTRRRRIQLLRKVDDRDIEKFLYPYSTEIYRLKKRVEDKHIEKYMFAYSTEIYRFKRKLLLKSV